MPPTSVFIPPSEPAEGAGMRIEPACALLFELHEWHRAGGGEDPPPRAVLRERSVEPEAELVNLKGMTGKLPGAALHALENACGECLRPAAREARGIHSRSLPVIRPRSGISATGRRTAIRRIRLPCRPASLPSPPLLRRGLSPAKGRTRIFRAVDVRRVWGGDGAPPRFPPAWRWEASRRATLVERNERSVTSAA